MRDSIVSLAALGCTAVGTGSALAFLREAQASAAQGVANGWLIVGVGASFAMLLGGVAASVLTTARRS